MKVDVIISVDYIREDLIKGKTVVVIDILRATSVITTAIMNGCKEVIPYLTLEEAFQTQEILKDQCILGGERKAIKVGGFDLSNSPLEYSRDVIANKTVILSTTNGTRTLVNCTSAYKVLIACMLNAKAVADRLLELGKDVVIVNSGTNGQFSMDDYICTGFVIRELLDLTNDIELTDIAKTAVKIYEANPNIIDYIKDAKHYKVMQELNLNKDIEYCIQKNITNIVPEYSNGHIIGIS